MNRRRRDEAPSKALIEMPSGTAVHYRNDDGTSTATVTRSEPWQLGDGTWVVMIKGRSGGMRLSRFSIAREGAT